MAESDLEMTTRDYGALVRRRWLLIIGGVLVGVGLGLAVFAYAPAKYMSTASVIVSATGSDTTVTNGKSTSEINLDTEAQIVKSNVVAGQAADILDNGSTAEQLAKKVSVTVPANTSVLDIAFMAGSAAAAQDGAQAFADAYLENRKTVEENRIDGQVKTLQSKIDDLNKQLRDTSVALDAATTDAAKSYLLTQRNLIVQQIRSSTSALDPLQAQDVVPGAVITKASLPSAPSGLSLTLVLASGLVFGLILGVLAAFIRDRRDRRIHSRQDLEALGIDVLVGRFDLSAPEDVLRQRQPGDEALRQCRNALLARLPQHRGSFLVTSVSADHGGATAAASLAVTLARSGVRTALVCCNTHYDITQDAPLVRGDGPTLTDVLRSGVAVSRALQPVQDIPDLLVVAPGKDGALFSGLLQSNTIRPALAEIEALVEVVVIDVAPTVVNADAQTVVSSTQGMLLVATSDRTASGEVVDAVDQMSNVDATLLGAVLVRPQRDRRRKGRRSAPQPVESSRERQPTP